MNRIIRYLLAIASLGLIVSCISEEMPSHGPSGNILNIEFRVSDFPDYGSNSTRAVGVQDEGKTSWENDDVILVSMKSEHFGVQTTALIYEDGKWIHEEDMQLSYLTGETLLVTATYAPGYELDSETGNIVPKQDRLLGTDEYLKADCSIEGNILRIGFGSDCRDYSRLRIATVPDATITVMLGNSSFPGSFIPAGTEQSVENGAVYTLPTDDKGNAYLYGTFTQDATIKVMCEGITLKEFRFKAEMFSNGTEHGKSYVLNAIPSYPLSAYHYASLEDAYADINNAELGVNTTEDKSSAGVAVEMEDGVYHCYILKDENDVSIDISSRSSIDLMGHKLTAASGMKMFNISADCEISDGALSGTADGSGTRNEPYIFINVAPEASVTMSGISADFNDENGGTISAVSIMEGGTAIISDSEIIVTSREGLMSTCVSNFGDCHLESCNLQAISNHCANASGNDYGQTARAVYSETSSSTSFKECTIYGAHSGATIKGKLYVNGGVYKGYSHGGLYISNGGAETQLQNADVIECDLPEGYIDDGIAGTNHAGIYIGGSSNMHIYVDNCYFYGMQQPIVLRGSSGESNNVLYISNSRINLDYTHYGVRNDGSNQIKIGLNNNFDVEDLKYNRNYELTDQEYKSENSRTASSC